MKYELYWNFRNISSFPEFYQYIHNEKRFYVFKNFRKICFILDVQTAKVVDLFGKEIPIPDRITKSIYNLPNKYQYVAFLEDGNIKPSYIPLSIYSHDPEFQTDQTLYLFDILDNSTPYDARLEKLKLIVDTSILNQISVYNPEPLYFTHVDTNIRIWNRLFMYTMKTGNIFIRKQNHIIVDDFDIPVYRDYTIVKGIIVKKDDSQEHRKIICKIKNDYLPVIGGIDDSYFESLQVKDKVQLAVRKTDHGFIQPVFIQKLD